MVESMALAATAAGADGLMIEVHNNPSCALCGRCPVPDADQFDMVAKKVQKVREVLFQ
jgi:3-deoxy-7-phosphoheptulonate synthase